MIKLALASVVLGWGICWIFFHWGIPFKAWCSQNFYLPDFQNLAFFNKDYIRFRRKLCQNLLAQLSVLLAPDHRVVGYVKPCPSQTANKVKNVSISWHHLVSSYFILDVCNVSAIMQFQRCENMTSGWCNFWWKHSHSSNNHLLLRGSLNKLN